MREPDETPMDVRDLATTWRAQPSISWTFRTASRIHPRFRAALEWMVEHGVVERTRLDQQVEGYEFTLKDKQKLLDIPVLSRKASKANALPITVH